MQPQPVDNAERCTRNAVPRHRGDGLSVQTLEQDQIAKIFDHCFSGFETVLSCGRRVIGSDVLAHRIGPFWTLIRHLVFTYHLADRNHPPVR